MEVIEVDSSVYREHLKPISVFTTSAFAELNKNKVDQLIFLLFKDSKIRLGIIFGKKDDVLMSPFSAPYGGFSYADPDCKAKMIDDAIAALVSWAEEKGFKKLNIALPALHYNAEFLTRVINGFYTHQFNIEAIDVNHHFESPKNFDEDYVSLLQRNARKNLNNALKQEFQWVKLSHEEAVRAYDVIAINRAAKQKPLRLTLTQVLEVSSITEVDFFVVNHQGSDVAAAIVFHVSNDLVQVVYWGDDPKFAELRSMNYLTYKVFQHYANLGIKVLEIGISTENSIPNYGLCEFKESIGCSVSLKYTFSKNLDVRK
jgi:hypothetical protein